MDYVSYNTDLHCHKTKANISPQTDCTSYNTDPHCHKTKANVSPQADYQNI